MSLLCYSRRFIKCLSKRREITECCWNLDFSLRLWKPFPQSQWSWFPSTFLTIYRLTVQSTNCLRKSFRKDEVFLPFFSATPWTSSLWDCISLPMTPTLLFLAASTTLKERRVSVSFSCHLFLHASQRYVPWGQMMMALEVNAFMRLL